jgi:hypothetical protein
VGNFLLKSDTVYLFQKNISIKNGEIMVALFWSLTHVPLIPPIISFESYPASLMNVSAIAHQCLHKIMLLAHRDA